MQLSDDQARALGAITEWYSQGSRPWLTLGGYAGTGKTTLLGELPRAFPGKRLHYASYTGKAVSVLAGKLPPGQNVTTLHRLLYKPQPKTVCKASKEPCTPGLWCSKHTPQSLVSDRDTPPCETVKQLDWSPNMFPLEGIDLVIVDEASMVSDKIWTDLTKWGVPVLAVGDHGQLPPIKSQFNLMQNPMIRLETILRQVEGSPIIKMATIARKIGTLPYRNFGADGEVATVIRPNQMPDYPMDPDEGDLIIAAYNRTRNELNESMRNLLGRKGLPQPGDIVICLRNSYEVGIFNGMRGRIKEFEVNDPTGTEAWAVIEMIDEGFDFSGQVYVPQFGAPKTDNQVGRWLNLFDYGYCMTAHKAQGSQADRVMVINERLPQTDHKRWLYTAVTRAAKELIVVGN